MVDRNREGQLRPAIEARHCPAFDVDDVPAGLTDRVASGFRGVQPGSAGVTIVQVGLPGLVIRHIRRSAGYRNASRVYAAPAPAATG